MLLLAFFSAAYSWWYYSKSVPPVTGFLRWVLFILRASSIALILICIASPVVETVLTAIKKTRVAVILDTSSSIKQPKDPSRMEDALRVFENLRSKLGNKAVLLGFDTSLKRLGDGAPAFDGIGTDMSTALSTALSMKYISSAVVISDGISNLGTDPLTLDNLREFPVNTVSLGKTGMIRDFSIGGISGSPLGRDGESLPVDISAVSPSGFSGNIKAEIIEKGKTAVSGKIDFHGTGASSTVFQLPLKGEGAHTFTVVIKPPDEDYTGNNSRTFSVKVLKSSYKILVSADKPSPDFAFIRRIIDSEKTFKPYYLVGGEINAGGKNTFPDNINDFDAAIFIDWGDTETTGKNIDRIKSRISSGMGAWFVGSSIPSGNIRTLAEILPLTYTGVNSPDSLYSIGLTETGQNHYVTSGDGSSASEWRSLPPLTSAAIVKETPGKGVVLATASPASGKSSPMPAIITGKYGKGKIVAMPVSGIWRWQLMLEGAGMDEGFYRGFVKGLANWLINENEETPLTVKTDYSSYLSGQEINLEARLFDSVYSPVSGAEIMVKTNASGIRTVLDESKPDIYTGKIGGLPPGEYSYIAAAFLKGKKYTETTGKILVENYSVEMVNTEPDNALLKKIAEVSGGINVSPSGIDSLTAVLSPKTITERLEKTWDFRMNPFFLAFIILLLAVEWGIRKNRGML
jgi:hypothetical protein